jgi:uncharacterized protein YqjF (DUF2071 family)
MSISTLNGVVRHRILVNFRIDPEVMQAQIPACFRLNLVDGWAMAGICLIRLEQLRPSGFPAAMGMSSVNAAHRVAVTWTDRADQVCEGVYIPRRDTATLLNYLVGGRLFPGQHRLARIVLREDPSGVEAGIDSDDGTADLRLLARASDKLSATSRFASLEAASSFFAGGSTGYSATRDHGRLDGLELRTLAWHVDALDVQSVVSSYFADQARFPPGSVEFDSALIMRDVPHAWRAVPSPDWGDLSTGPSVCDHQGAGKETLCSTRSLAQPCRFSR